MSKIIDEFEKKVATYPFNVSGMSVEGFREFKEDAYNNFNDSYANKIMFDHKYRTEMKPLFMLNDKVDLIFENLMTRIMILEQKIETIVNYIDAQNSNNEEKETKPEDRFQTLGGGRR